MQKRRTRRPLVLKLNSKMLWPTWACPIRQRPLLACASRNFVNVSCSNDCGNAPLASFVDMSPGVCASTVSSRMSSSSELVSMPFVASCNNAFAGRYLVPACCTTVKSNSENRRRHQAMWPVKAAKLRIRFSASWSIRTLKRWPSKSGRRGGRTKQLRGIRVKLRHIAFQCWWETGTNFQLIWLYFRAVSVVGHSQFGLCMLLC